MQARILWKIRSSSLVKLAQLSGIILSLAACSQHSTESTPALTSAHEDTIFREISLHKSRNKHYYPQNLTSVGSLPIQIRSYPFQPQNNNNAEDGLLSALTLDSTNNDSDNQDNSSTNSIQENQYLMPLAEDIHRGMQTASFNLHFALSTTAEKLNTHAAANQLNFAATQPSSTSSPLTAATSEANNNSLPTPVTTSQIPSGVATPLTPAALVPAIPLNSNLHLTIPIPLTSITTQNIPTPSSSTSSPPSKSPQVKINYSAQASQGSSCSGLLLNSTTLITFTGCQPQINESAESEALLPIIYYGPQFNQALPLLSTQESQDWEFSVIPNLVLYNLQPIVDSQIKYPPALPASCLASESTPPTANSTESDILLLCQAVNSLLAQINTPPTPTQSAMPLPAPAPSSCPSASAVPPALTTAISSN